MKKTKSPPERKTCVNGDGRPIQPPSEVLCRECLDALDKKMHALLGPKQR